MSVISAAQSITPHGGGSHRGLRVGELWATLAPGVRDALMQGRIQSDCGAGRPPESPRPTRSFVEGRIRGAQALRSFGDSTRGASHTDSDMRSREFCLKGTGMHIFIFFFGFFSQRTFGSTLDQPLDPPLDPPVDLSLDSVLQ